MRAVVVDKVVNRIGTLEHDGVREQNRNEVNLCKIAFVNSAINGMVETEASLDACDWVTVSRM